MRQQVAVIATADVAKRVQSEFERGHVVLSWLVAEGF
jgi:hypothetical protein